MIQSIYAGITPPSAHGRAVHRENKIVESSPINGAATALQPVPPVRPAAGYIGGKRNLSRRLVTLIGEVPHDTYAEVFVGMGGIFLRRNLKPRAEVINDWSEDVSTFFRILQRHYVAFMDMLRFQLTTRAGFERLVQTDPTTLTDLERSARFLYLQRLAFGGKVAGRSFGVDPINPGRFDVTKLGPLLEALHERLSGVVIERLHWSKFIERYDRPGTLFYLDPPYFGCEKDYGEGMFGRDDFILMADRLAGLKGRFILSLNDRPEVRNIFSAFAIADRYDLYCGWLQGRQKGGRIGHFQLPVNWEIRCGRFVRSTRVPWRADWRKSADIGEVGIGNRQKWESQRISAVHAPCNGPSGYRKDAVGQ